MPINANVIIQYVLEKCQSFQSDWNKYTVLELFIRYYAKQDKLDEAIALANQLCPFEKGLAFINIFEETCEAINCSEQFLSISLDSTKNIKSFQKNNLIDSICRIYTKLNKPEKIYSLINEIQDDLKKSEIAASVSFEFAKLGQNNKSLEFLDFSETILGRSNPLKDAILSKICINNVIQNQFEDALKTLDLIQDKGWRNHCNSKISLQYAKNGYYNLALDNLRLIERADLHDQTIADIARIYSKEINNTLIDELVSHLKLKKNKNIVLTSVIEQCLSENNLDNAIKWALSTKSIKSSNKLIESFVENQEKYRGNISDSQVSEINIILNSILKNSDFDSLYNYCEVIKILLNCGYVNLAQNLFSDLVYRIENYDNLLYKIYLLIKLANLHLVVDDHKSSSQVLDQVFKELEFNNLLDADDIYSVSCYLIQNNFIELGIRVIEMIGDNSERGNSSAVLKCHAYIKALEYINPLKLEIPDSLWTSFIVCVDLLDESKQANLLKDVVDIFELAL